MIIDCFISVLVSETISYRLFFPYNALSMIIFQMFGDAILIIIIAIFTAVIGEGLTYLLVYRLVEREFA